MNAKLAVKSEKEEKNILWVNVIKIYKLHTNLEKYFTTQ